MAHEILGNRFIARSKPAWHNIAKRIFPETETITASQAMVEVAGDVVVVKAPMAYELDGKVTRSDHFAIVRKPLPESPECKVLGVTNEAWVAASYSQLAAGLDELSKTYHVESAGLLKDGGLAFLCFRAEDYSVRGDEMRTYFAANFSLTPGKGHNVLHSPVRVVCWNTNTMAFEQATINLSIPHTSDAMQKIQLAGKLATQFKATQNKAQAIFESFADLHISQAEAQLIFAAAFPEPAMPSKVRLLKNALSETEAETFKRALTADLLIGIQKAEESWAAESAMVERLRKTAFERFDVFDPANLRGTGWAAYNAVTEVSDWREGRGADASALMGSRAQEKSRAFAATLALVK